VIKTRRKATGPINTVKDGKEHVDLEIRYPRGTQSQVMDSSRVAHRRHAFHCITHDPMVPGAQDITTRKTLSPRNHGHISQCNVKVRKRSWIIPLCRGVGYHNQLSRFGRGHDRQVGKVPSTRENYTNPSSHPSFAEARMGVDSLSIRFSVHLRI
jgi:hypothetical protein